MEPQGVLRGRHRGPAPEHEPEGPGGGVWRGRVGGGGERRLGRLGDPHSVSLLAWALTLRTGNPAFVGFPWLL